MKMLIPVLGVVAIALGCLGHDSDPDSEDKAAITGFRKLVEALSNGRSALDYNGYGNYCGIGGSGVPVDGVDKCCQAHDKCYEDAQKAQCKSQVPGYIYVAVYSYIAKPGYIECTEGKGWLSSGLKRFLSSTYNCGVAICYCDAEAARCFSRNKYNQKNKKNLITAG